MGRFRAIYHRDTCSVTKGSFTQHLQISLQCFLILRDWLHVSAVLCVLKTYTWLCLTLYL